MQVKFYYLIILETMVKSPYITFNEDKNFSNKTAV